MWQQTLCSFAMEAPIKLHDRFHNDNLLHPGLECNQLFICTASVHQTKSMYDEPIQEFGFIKLHNSCYFTMLTHVKDSTSIATVLGF